MKLCNILIGGLPHLAAKTDRGIVDLSALQPGLDMATVLAGGDLNRLEALCAQAETVLDEGSVVFSNICQPQKLICVGLNYKKHAEETKGEPPKEPVLFSKYNDALCPAGHAVALPRWQRCFDYEAELVIVVGRHAWNVPVGDAPSYIFGYTCGNDLSARDCQFISNQWLIGKSFPDFGPAGPYITTADSFDPNAAHRITCTVNGALAQDDMTNGMIFNCAEIVSYASRFFPLAPGDLIYTGTPSGVILGHPKGQRTWLKPGDEVSVTIDGLGTLTNRLV